LSGRQRRQRGAGRHRELRPAACRRRARRCRADGRPQHQGRDRGQLGRRPIDVTALVQDALDRHALFTDDSDVEVDTVGDTVTLSGHVRTWAEHDAAVGAAWMASGVNEVTDDIDITG